MLAREVQPEMFVLKRRRSSKKKPFPFGYFTSRAFVVFTIVFLLVLSLFFVTRVMASDHTKPKEKTVASVYIRPGDSLWSIAEQYYSEECGSMKDYIAEIKRSNGLKEDTIHVGAYIIVPYYTVR